MGKHDCIERINSRSSGALVRGQRGDDTIFTISVMKCNRRLHHSKQFGLKHQGTETNGKGET